MEETHTEEGNLMVLLAETTDMSVDLISPISSSKTITFLN
jgi:hypothetical protein